jgi:hypothetical protein
VYMQFWIQSSVLPSGSVGATVAFLSSCISNPVRGEIKTINLSKLVVY